MKNLVLCIAVGAIGLNGAEVRGELLARIHYDEPNCGPDKAWTGGGGEIWESMTVMIGIGKGVEGPDYQWNLGTLSASDQGRSLTASSLTVGNYSRLDFSGMAGLLSNGEPGRAGNGDVFLVEFLRSNGGSSTGVDEKRLFDNYFPAFATQVFVPRTGNDLAGYRIDSMVMRIDTMQFLHPDSEPNYTYYRSDFTFDIYGQPVPEPSTLIGLVSVGIVGLGLAWSRRRRAAKK